MKKAFAVTLFLLAARMPAAEIQVAAAASLTDALKEIAAEHEKATGDHVVFNFGASSLLARQISEGFPADLFFSADEEKMDALAKEGLVEEATRRSLLGNTLVVVVPRDGATVIRSLRDLLDPKLRTIAVAETRTVPAGIYARRYLEKLGVFRSLEPRLVPTENVRAALAAVEAGNADAGIVYKTDALVSKNLRVALEVSGADAPDISYPIALLKRAARSAAAKRFLLALESDTSARVFSRYGFRVRGGR